MRIWQKIMLGFISVIIIMIIVDSSALINNIRIIDEVEKLERSRRVELAQSNKIAYLVQNTNSNIRELFLEIEHNKRKDEIIRARNIIETNLTEICKSIKILRNATEIGYELSEEEDKEEEMEEMIKIDSLEAYTRHFVADIKKYLNFWILKNLKKLTIYLKNVQNFFQEKCRMLLMISQKMPKMKYPGLLST